MLPRTRICGCRVLVFLFRSWKVPITPKYWFPAAPGRSWTIKGANRSLDTATATGIMDCLPRDIPNPLSAPERADPSRSEESQTPQRDQPPAGPLLGAPLLVVMAAAFAIVLPFIFLGVPSGHDFNFHLLSWMEVLGQWKQGVIYPRWASLAHWGNGEPRFIFYPPASWLLGAGLGALLPWNIVPGVYVWIALVASGISMFLLARRLLSRNNAILAAVIYLANPYHIVTVYWRSAFAELLASPLFPLLLLLVLRMERGGCRLIWALGVVLAAAWLTNAPSAIILNYSIALLLVTLCLLERSPRLLLYGAAAVVLGAMLAGFYLIPAVYEQRWVNIAELLRPSMIPQDNFLFTRRYNIHLSFNRVVSIIASTEMLILGALAWHARKSYSRQGSTWWLVLVWTAAAALLMFPITSALWQYLPKLRFVQFPWRLLLCLGVGFSLVVVAGTRRAFSRAVVCLMLLGVTLFGQHFVSLHWRHADSFQEMYGAVQNGEGYKGAAEYVPAGSDPRYEPNRQMPKVAAESDVPARIEIQEWAAESKRFTAESQQPTRLVVRLFNYPAWHVEANGRAVSADTKVITGQMVIALGAGRNRVNVVFARTWDRIAGAVISAVTFLFLLVYLVYWKHKPLMRYFASV